MRIKNSKEDIEVQNLLHKQKVCYDPKIEQEICEQIYGRYRKNIFEQIHTISDIDGTMSSSKM